MAGRAAGHLIKVASAGELALESCRLVQKMWATFSPATSTFVICNPSGRVASIGLKLPEEGIDLEEVEKEILLQALERHGWNQTHAAKYLNISRKTLIYRMEKFALLPPTQSAV